MAKGSLTDGDLHAGEHAPQDDGQILCAHTARGGGTRGGGTRGGGTSTRSQETYRLGGARTGWDLGSVVACRSASASEMSFDTHRRCGEAHPAISICAPYHSILSHEGTEEPSLHSHTHFTAHFRVRHKGNHFFFIWKPMPKHKLSMFVGFPSHEIVFVNLFQKSG